MPREYIPFLGRDWILALQWPLCIKPDALLTPSGLGPLHHVHTS